MSSIIHVAIGVIINQDDQVLIAKRASHQHQGDKWEFPGGKVEEGESSQTALHRELKEEIGIEVNSSQFLFTVNHQYEDIEIHFDTYEVNDWLGNTEGREGQPLLWVDKSTLNQYDFPSANTKILKKLDLSTLDKKS